MDFFLFLVVMDVASTRGSNGACRMHPSMMEWSQVIYRALIAMGEDISKRLASRGDLIG
jgi:hypothetical protein